MGKKNPIKRTFEKAVLLEKLRGEDEVLRVLEDASRWTLGYRFVFRHEGKLYETGYSVGATEHQDEGPWEYEDTVECVEVEAYERVVTDYRSVEA